MGNERGFTLLEVVIALGILALALPILLGLRNWDLDLHARAKEMTAATILAQEKLIETELGTLLPLGETSGEFLPTPLGSQPTTVVTNRQSNYRWKRIVSSTPLPIVREVKIQVLWPRGTIDEMLEVSTYVFSTTPTP
ncbi:MAG TPA: prepilin-type N-terminal cleavage/methylation domain-containing protein [Nitrospiraceae bacterium]|nr:prepilin-type N-terminal cleavage/methylation domain-containing protein [Nitrospiraceae bacterium]